MKKVTLLLMLIAAPGDWPLLCAQSTSVLQPFTLHSRTSVRRPDGRVSEREEVEYVFSDGSLRLIHRPTDSYPIDLYYIPGVGRFMVDYWNEKLKKGLQVHANRPCGDRRAEDFMNSPDYVRQEQVLGLTAYVHRFTEAKGGEVLREVYYAPELGCFALKAVFYEKGEVVRVTEPILVLFEEPDRRLLELPEYPVVEDSSF